ncbi:MAG: DUF3301 domain-containing protein [Nitrosomonadales bacterium]|nr:DUF3301 domain-containing protein [Nitrosomonadales bacterium]
MEISFIILMLLGAWYWLDSITSREAAINNGRDLAQRWNLQLLDETVSCTRLRLGRNSRGQAKIMRTYEFEVSTNGSDRLECHLILLGKQLQSWHIPPYLQPLH